MIIYTHFVWSKKKMFLFPHFSIDFDSVLSDSNSLSWWFKLYTELFNSLIIIIRTKIPFKKKKMLLLLHFLTNFFNFMSLPGHHIFIFLTSSSCRNYWGGDDDMFPNPIFPPPPPPGSTPLVVYRNFAGMCSRCAGILRGPNLAKGSICTFALEKLSEKINFEVWAFNLLVEHLRVNFSWWTLFYHLVYRWKIILSPFLLF